MPALKQRPLHRHRICMAWQGMERVSQLRLRGMGRTAGGTAAPHTSHAAPSPPTQPASAACSKPDASAAATASRPLPLVPAWSHSASASAVAV